MASDEPPITYGDLRLKADRQHGPCLFWVRSPAALHERCAAHYWNPAHQELSYRRWYLM
jgi:hypothetical protein